MMLRFTMRPARLACLAAILLAACGDDAQQGPPSPPFFSGPAAVNLAFGAAPPTTFVVGQSALLSWRADHATACTASGAWSGSRPVTGSESVTPTTAGSQTYTLTCTGLGAAATQVVSLNVQPTATIADVVLTLGAAPLTLELGNPTLLTWTVANAESCAASGAWTGPKTSSGTESVTPVMLGRVVYRLLCTGAGASDTQEIEVVVTDPHAESLAEFRRLRALENTP